MDLQSIEMRNLDVQDYQELKKSMKFGLFRYGRGLLGC